MDTQHRTESTYYSWHYPQYGETTDRSSQGFRRPARGKRKTNRSCGIFFSVAGGQQCRLPACQTPLGNRVHWYPHGGSVLSFLSDKGWWYRIWGVRICQPCHCLPGRDSGRFAESHASLSGSENYLREKKAGCSNPLLLLPDWEIRNNWMSGTCPA